ncbi:MAG TPA: DUF499 domain-containing protein, partial [Polyangiaceae bacterium]|nr:DUF499 domain-containing protein [Polyangiaceae bacterium]
MMVFRVLRTTRDACTPDPSVLRSDYKDQIEDLATLRRNASEARAFFARNHVTSGMRLLFEQCLRRLASKSDQGVFELTQAMGGGKTHSMVALGLIVKDDALRAEVVPEQARSAAFTGARVVAFSGRSYPDHFFWGEIAAQLGRPELFRRYWQNGPSAPDEPAWLELLGSEPTLILLDELPPYFEYHVTKVVGGGNAAQVAQAAFANLLTAALKSPRTAVVVANLRGAYDSASRDLQRVLRDAGQELGRSAKAIVPVDLASDEIFEILRKRLFSSLPNADVVTAVGEAYAKSFAEAVKSQAIAKSSEQIATEIQGSYPFHPSLKDIIALFRENESFRQTRGLMRFVAQLVRSVWNRPANDVHLIGMQHLDLSDSDVRAEVTGIAEALANAIASDVSSSNGSAKAEVIDAQLGKDCAAEVARLLLAASLGKTVGGVRGMTRQRTLECLVAPNTSVHEFAEAFDALVKEAWYLHRDGELHHFTAMENLTKRLSSELREAPQNKIDQEMRRRLEETFKAKERKAYDKVHALPLLDDVNLREGRVLLVLSPDTKDPPREALAYYHSIAEKNNVCILTGDGSDLSNLEAKTRMLYAIVKLKRVIPESSPQQAELEEKLEQAEQDFNATLRASLDRLYYPAKTGLERAKF